MAIARQSLTIGADEDDGDTTSTTSVTVSAGSDLLLLVAIHLEMQGTGADHVSTVVWNGASLTELDKTWGNGWAETQFFYLKNPTPATGNLVTTTTAANIWGGRHVAYVLTGVDQTTTFRTTQRSTQGGSNAASSSLTVPSVVSGDYLVDALTVDSVGHSIVAGANQFGGIRRSCWSTVDAGRIDASGCGRRCDVVDVDDIGGSYAHVAVGLIASGGAAATSSRQVRPRRYRTYAGLQMRGKR